MFFYTEEVAQGKVRKNVLCVKRLPHLFCILQNIESGCCCFFLYFSGF